MSKRITYMLMVVMAMGILAGCGGNNNNSSSASNSGGSKGAVEQEKVHLVIWDWLSGDKTKGPGLHFSELDAAYMKVNPHVTIERVAQPADKYYDILKPALLAKTGPDIYQLHDSRPAEYKELTLPLNDLMPAEAKANLVGLDVFTVDEELLAYPVGLQGNVWYYNKQIFKDAGLDPEKTPTTWEELLSIMDQLKAKGITPVAVGDKEGEYIANWAFSMNLANQLTVDEIMALAKGELAWTDSRVQAAYQQAADLFLKGYSQKSALTTAIYPDNGEVFKKGEAALTIGLLADVLNWKEFGDAIGADNIGVFINPAPANAAHPNTLYADPGIGFAVNKTTKHAQAAADFLAYLTNAENLGKYHVTTGTLPNNKKTDTSIIQDPIAKDLFVLATTNSRSTQAGQRLSQPVKEAFVQGSQKVLFNSQTIDQFLKDVQAVADKQ